MCCMCNADGAIASNRPYLSVREFDSIAREMAATLCMKSISVSYRLLVKASSWDGGT